MRRRERVPLSEMEIGQAGRVVAVGTRGRPGRAAAASRAPAGHEVVRGGRRPAWRAGALPGERERRFSLSRAEANQIVLDAGTIREIVLPRPPWLQENGAVRELFMRYGSLTVTRRALVFFGPAFVISVGYMDPGNWGTDIEGGARFGYQLLWVILLANLMAILLQTLSAKLGIATGRSLPEVCRDHYPRWASVGLWVTAELAAIMTDLAEFLGGAVGLNLLFHIPLFPAALITGVIISLILYLERYGSAQDRDCRPRPDRHYRLRLHDRDLPGQAAGRRDPARAVGPSLPGVPPWSQSASSARPSCRTTCTCTAP